MSDSELADPEDGEDRTPAALADDDRLGVDVNWNTQDSEWPREDYASVPIPRDEKRPKTNWTVPERRAWLLRKLKEYGTWNNVPYTQDEIGDMFDRHQHCIHKDLEELRKYIRFHAGSKAISMSELVAQKAVTEMLDPDSDEYDPYKAWRVQSEFDEFLFELGRLDRAPDKKQVHNINEQVSSDDLDDEEMEHFQHLSDQLQQNTGQQDDDVIDVESTEVDVDG